MGKQLVKLVYLWDSLISVAMDVTTSELQVVDKAGCSRFMW